MLNLKLDQMRAFLHVAYSGSMTGAAQILNVTQPAISARIRNLEELIGGALFHREEGQCRLNTRGALFLQHAERLEHLMARIECNVATLSTMQGRVRFGVAETVAQGLFLDVIRALARSAPGVSIELQVDLSPRLHSGLISHEYDLTMALGRPDDERVRSISLPPVSLRWYTSASDPVETIDNAKRLFDKPVFTHARKSSAYRDLREQIWTRVGVEVELIPSSSLYSSMNLVASGLGVAALPEYLVSKHVADGTLRAFDPGWQPGSLQFSAHYLSDPPNPLIDRVAKIVEQTAHLQSVSQAH